MLGFESKNEQWNAKSEKSQAYVGAYPEKKHDTTDGKGKYDTEFLRHQVSQTEYISNLRIGRSWILPQLVQMGFTRKLMSTKFDISHFEKNLNKKYNSTAAGRSKIWNLIKRNYKVVANSNGTAKRGAWWTKDLIVEIMDWDYGMIGKQNKGVDKEKCAEIISRIRGLSDPNEIYKAIVEYDECRMRFKNIDTYVNRINGRVTHIPKVFITAFMGDGAYNAMSTMVKVLDLRMKTSDGRLLTRDECIDEIEKQSSMLNGMELLIFCKKTFFDSGIFEYKKYTK